MAEEVSRDESRETSEWATFRGGAEQRGFRPGKVADAPKLLWTFDAKTAIESTAAIAGGRVYLGSADAGLLALELLPAAEGGGVVKSGRELWRAPNEAGIRSSPGVSGGVVYFGDDAGVFHALDAKSGKEVWTFKAGEGSEIISSASFFKERVLFGSYDSNLYCLEAKDGKLLWKFQTEGPLHSTPAIAEGRTFVAGCDEHLRVIDVEKGKEIWALPMGSYSAATPALDGDRLFVGNFGCQVLCVNWKGAGEGRSPILWTYENPERKFPFYASPAVAPFPDSRGGGGSRRVVVACGRDKLVHAIDGDTGKGLWKFQTGARVDASPVVAGNRVVAAGLDGNLYLLDLEQGKEVWRFTAGAAFLASPAVAAGKLVISTEEGLIYCFDLSPKE